MRYLCLALSLFVFSAAAQAFEACENNDLRGTWRVYTSPLQMPGGSICTTSCQLRVGRLNRAVTPPSDCVVQIGDSRESFDLSAGELKYFLDSDNSKRYAVVEGLWSFRVYDEGSPIPHMMEWDFRGEQEHAWVKRNSKPSQGALCRTKHEKQERVGTIHGVSVVRRDGVVVGQVMTTMVWRSPVTKIPGQASQP